MAIADILKGLKDKILDAATYELLKRNFDLLESNNAQLKDKVALQNDEVARLKADKLRLSEQVGGLAAELDMLKAQSAAVNKSVEIDELDQKAMLFLAEHYEGTAHDAAKALGISSTKAAFYLEKLCEDQFINAKRFAGGRVEYSLAQKGREFLVKLNLI